VRGTFLVPLSTTKSSKKRKPIENTHLVVGKSPDEPRVDDDLPSRESAGIYLVVVDHDYLPVKKKEGFLERKRKREE
jgi:hypothetical protein